MAGKAQTSVDKRLLAALDELDSEIADNVVRGKEIQRRVRRLRRNICDGKSLSESVRNEPVPRTVELITANIDALHGIGAQLRSTQAQALRDEGLTMSAIAELFGVTRQRVSALLRQRSATTKIGSTGRSVAKPRR